MRKLQLFLVLSNPITLAMIAVAATLSVSALLVVLLGGAMMLIGSAMAAIGTMVLSGVHKKTSEFIAAHRPAMDGFMAKVTDLATTVFAALTAIHEQEEQQTVEVVEIVEPQPSLAQCVEEPVHVADPLGTFADEYVQHRASQGDTLERDVVCDTVSEFMTVNGRLPASMTELDTWEEPTKVAEPVVETPKPKKTKKATKPNSKYSQEDLIQAVEMVKDGVSIRKAANDCGVPESTLRTKVKQSKVQA